jgi:hypothetical protein
MLHDRIIRWSLPASVGETAVNLTSGYELVHSSCGDGVWRDVDRCKSSEIDQIFTRITLKWWENWWHVDLKTVQKQKSWWQELVPTTARDDPPESWTPGFANRKYVRNFGTVLWPSLPRPRALRLDLDCGLLAPFTKFIHPSVQWDGRTDGRTDSQPDRMLEVESTIYRLIKRFPFFFLFNFVMLLKW